MSAPDEDITRPRKPTLRTVASASGFAVTTVSRALAGDTRIAAKTRAKIECAAKDLGYVPDRAAQRLRTGQTKVISLLLNPDHEYLGFTNELMNGLSEALIGTDYAVSITPDFIRQDRMSVLERILTNRLADGVIFTRTEPFDPRVRLLTEKGFPFVCHGRTDFTTPHPWVDFDNEAFARAAVRRLVAQGRTRLSMILPSAQFTFTEHLRYGFINEARGAGVDFELPGDVSLESEPDDVAASIRRRRDAPNPPDGYVCVGEVIALATLATLQDAGLAPGQDVGVVAKRASPIFKHFRPRLDTVFEDIRQTGRDIGRILLQRLRNEPASDMQSLQSPIMEFNAQDTARRTTTGVRQPNA